MSADRRATIVCIKFHMSSAAETGMKDGAIEQRAEGTNPLTGALPTLESFGGGSMQGWGRGEGWGALR